jgi:uncharacterized membrane protein
MEWIMLAHIVVAAVWFGGSVYLEALMANAARTGDPQIMGTVAITVGKTNPRIFGTVGVLTLLTGIWLIVAENSVWEFSDLFVSVGFLVAIVGIALGILFVDPQMKKIEAIMAERGPADPEVEERGMRISMVAHMMTLLLAIVMVFMVIKPWM